uniref:KIND domain-containing protein n=1 Tax=Cyanistes caeruleus TaxID=156563 RepID=A0A8C0ZFE5_CYACU
RARAHPAGSRARPARAMPPWVSLADLLRCFEHPVSEEQAWAICFQCCRRIEQVAQGLAGLGNRQPSGARTERAFGETAVPHVEIE